MLSYQNNFLLLSKIFCHLGFKLGLPIEKINILISQFSSSKLYYKQSIGLLLIGIIKYYSEISLTITEIFVIFLIIIIVVLIICKFMGINLKILIRDYFLSLKNNLLFFFINKLLMLISIYYTLNSNLLILSWLSFSFGDDIINFTWVYSMLLTSWSLLVLMEKTPNIIGLNQLYLTEGHKNYIISKLASLANMTEDYIRNNIDISLENLNSLAIVLELRRFPASNDLRGFWAFGIFRDESLSSLRMIPIGARDTIFYEGNTTIGVHI